MSTDTLIYKVNVYCIVLLLFLFCEPSNEGDAVRRRVVDAAETAQCASLLIAELLTGDFTVQCPRYAPS